MDTFNYTARGDDYTNDIIKYFKNIKKFNDSLYHVFLLQFFYIVPNVKK